MENTTITQDGRRRRFKAWDNLTKMFRRKPDETGQGQPRSPGSLTSSLGPACVSSRSTTDLVAAEREFVTCASEVGTLYPSGGLSLESILEIDSNPAESTRIANVNSMFSISIQHLDELRSAIRGRRSSTSDEDLGLPHSPTTTSLDAADVIGSNLHDRLLNSRSTGSDASLLSMDSCEMTEEEAAPPVKHQPQDMHLDNQHNVDLDTGERCLEETSNRPLNHSAAHHKMAVRPKRNHAAPRHRRLQQLSGNSEGLPEANVNGVLPNGDRKEAESSPRSARIPEKRDITPIKIRSQSLTRGETLSTSPADASSSSASSAAKLARSKSSVDKKTQNDVLTRFWKSTKNPEEGSHPSKPKPMEPNSAAPSRQKNLRKIKREKEEKKKKESGNNFRSNFESPFLSRIFSSKRKQLKAQDYDSRDSQDSDSSIPVANKGYESISVTPESIPKDLPRYSGPQHQKRISRIGPKKQGPDFDDPEILPQNNRPRIHIAGLSPYQRRVARVGNELEISDQDLDEEFFGKRNDRNLLQKQQSNQNQRRTQSFRENPDSEESNLDSLNSLPADINKDFILKKPENMNASQNFRKSLDSFKFSNEGLKKTIDSLNHRLSQSSDQLLLSDDSTKRSCSLSTDSTSSLNISDMEASPLSSLTLSKESLDLYASEGSDAVLDSTDEEQQRSCETSVFQNSQKEARIVPEFLQVQLHKVEVKPAILPNEEEAGSKQKSSEIVPVFRKTKPEVLPKPTVKAKPEVLAKPPVFSMNVRVQNVSYGRSLSVPAKPEEKPVILHIGQDSAAPKKPHITCIRMTSEEPPIIPKLKTHPWSDSGIDPTAKPKEANDSGKSASWKEKLNSSAPLKSVAPIPEASQTAEVKLRQQRDVKEKEGEPELMKVFARRSLKMPDDVSTDRTEATQSIQASQNITDTSNNNNNNCSPPIPDCPTNIWKRIAPERLKDDKLTNNETKASKVNSARNSRVLDMVNSFQRLQVV